MYVFDPVGEHAVQELRESDRTDLNPNTKETLEVADEEVKKKKKLEKLQDSFESLAILAKEVIGDKTQTPAGGARMADSPCVPIVLGYGRYADVERLMDARTLSDSLMTSHIVPRRVMEIKPKESTTAECKEKVTPDEPGRLGKDSIEPDILLYDWGGNTLEVFILTGKDGRIPTTASSTLLARPQPFWLLATTSRLEEWGRQRHV